MKKIIFILVACTLILVPVFSSCGESAPTKTIELTYANFFPPTHLHSKLGEQFCEAVNAETNGAVVITYYPGGTLTPAPQTYDAVVEGIADIGMSCCAYSMGRFPATELVDYPFGYPSGWVATKVANDFYNKFKPAEFDDTHLLYHHAHGPGLVLTTKKPVRKLEDLKGLVIRSTGVGAKIADALGAEGYGASQKEAYELLSKGTIDGSLTPAEVLKGWKQAEVINYVTNCYKVGYTTDFFVTMNKDKWNSLPGSAQKVITKLSEEWIDKHGMVWTYYDKAGKDYLLTFKGREWIELSDAEQARWIAAVAPIKDTYKAEKSKMGLPAAEYEKYLPERIKHWSGKAPSADKCVEWVNKEFPK